MEFSRQEYWSGLPFPSPGHLPNPGIEAGSPSLAGTFFTAEPPGKPKYLLQKGNSYLEFFPWLLFLEKKNLSNMPKRHTLG